MYSVTALETHHYVAGQQITMKLMKKPRGSLCIHPVAAADCTDAQQFLPLVTGWFVIVSFVMIPLNRGK